MLASSATGRAKREQQWSSWSSRLFCPAKGSQTRDLLRARAVKQRHVAIDGERTWKKSLPVQWKFPEFYAGGRCLKSRGSKFNFSMIVRALFEYEMRFPCSQRDIFMRISNFLWFSKKLLKKYQKYFMKSKWFRNFIIKFKDKFNGFPHKYSHPISFSFTFR